MRVISTNEEMFQARHDAVEPVGLVPTMGALHAGHLSLVDQARADNLAVAVSIFVNPTQFGDQTDLATYPRNIQNDIRMLRNEGVDIVFTPVDSEMYPQEFDTWVEPGKVARRLEGQHRQKHFRGVCTIVLKLFNTFHPDRSYFGQKDAQQLMVIRRMVEELALGIDIIAVPTVREHDGLALSSRNINLSHAERQAAPVLYRALCLAKEFVMCGQGNTVHVREAMRECIATEALAVIDYVSIADAETLDELTFIDKPAIASLAVTIGTTRLIDNVLLPKAG